MPEKRMMRLGAFMRPVGIHTAWWRYPGAYPDANFNLKHIIRLAQKLEAGKFDERSSCGRPSGGAEHADGGLETQRHGSPRSTRWRCCRHWPWSPSGSA